MIISSDDNADKDDDKEDMTSDDSPSEHLGIQMSELAPRFHKFGPTHVMKAGLV